MTDLYTIYPHPTFDSPVLILALEGWIDAGGASSRLTTSILEDADTIPVASFNADLLLDHRSRRPIMRIEDGVHTELVWPSIELVGLNDPHGRDVLVLSGAEPDHQWQAVARSVVSLASELGVRLIIGVGAFPAAAPHTRPALIASTTASPELVDRRGTIRSTIDVPAGIQAAIEVEAAAAGIPAIGLWAQVPHYAAGMPYPAASLSLAAKVNELGTLSFPTGTLASEATAVTNRLNKLVADNSEHTAMLRQLEEHVDEQAENLPELGTSTQAPDEADLPSGEELAGEIERFLRGQGS